MSDAQQGLAPDCLQRALRSRFRQQVKAGVDMTSTVKYTPMAGFRGGRGRGRDFGDR